MRLLDSAGRKEAAFGEVAAARQRSNKERAIVSALDGGNVELEIENKPATLRLISWEAPGHCSLQLFDEPLENEELTDSPKSRAVLELLHTLLTEAGYDPEWIGPDEDIGDEPFGRK